MDIKIFLQVRENPGVEGTARTDQNWGRGQDCGCMEGVGVERDINNNGLFFKRLDTTGKKQAN